MTFVKQLLYKTVFKNSCSRSFSSALYITGDKAHNNFAVVTPVLDFENRLKNRVELEKNIRLRGLSIDLINIEKRWNFYKHLDEQKITLEVIKTEIGKEIVRLNANPEKNAKDIEKLKLHGKLAKEDLRIIKDFLYGVEESAALTVLDLPNDLHEKTPDKDAILVHSFLEKPEGKSKSHIELATRSNLIEYLNPMMYYLKNQAAFFELSAVDHVSSILLNSSFQQFSNADFSRSVVVEGCGCNFLNKLEVFTLEQIHSDVHHEFSRLHLTGGASLPAFMAYFTRNSIPQAYFPLKLFTSGRKYQPTGSNEPSLLNVSQETAVEVFIATVDDSQELQKNLDDLILQVIKIYELLGQHFRLVYLPANKLKKYESLRLSVQMYSSYLTSYVEVGNISVCDSYISKRLLFSYTHEKDYKFPKIISGSLLRVPPLLACILENSSLGKMEDLPSVLKNVFLKNF